MRDGKKGNLIRFIALSCLLAPVFVALLAIIYHFFPESVKLNSALLSAILTLVFSVLVAGIISKIASGVGNEMDKAEQERANAEAKMEKSQKDFYILFTSNPNPMWVYDRETLKFLEVNESAVAHYGYTREEFFDMRITDIRPKEDVPSLLEDLKKDRESFSRSGEWKHVLKNGEIVHVAISSHTIEFADRQGVLVVARDITQQKQAEEDLKKGNEQLKEALKELRQTQHQMIQQERLRAIGTMASGIAHDFNNALSPILGYSDLLLSNPENLENREKLLKALQVIHCAALDAGKVVGRLREFYRRQEISETFVPVDLSHVIRESILLTEPKWRSQALVDGATVAIVTDLPDIPSIMGNEAELREMLTNLIFNAVDAMPDGGNITLRVYPENNKVILEVIDEGSGMSDEVKGHCFEPFFSTKGDRGTGLGLPMVSGIVNRHIGTIEVKSKLGEGTKFVMRFPITEKLQGKAEGEKMSEQEQSLHILLVDDEETVREILLEYLISEGHRVVTAANGRDGLEKYNPHVFDLVIADKAMPQMSGEKLAAAIRQITPRKPFILLTGSPDAYQSGQYPPGVDLVLGKPVTLRDVCEAISRVMEANLRKTSL